MLCGLRTTRAEYLPQRRELMQWWGLWLQTCCKSLTLQRVSPPILTGAGMEPLPTSRQNVDLPMLSTRAASVAEMRLRYVGSR